MVSYVLLITIGIALALLVYGWLKFYTAPTGEDMTCPEDIALIMDDYIYNMSSSTLNITIKNQGLFSTDGFILKIHDRIGADLGFYIINETGVALEPRESVNLEQDVSDYNPLTVVEIQPFILNGEYKTLCPNTFIFKPEAVL